MKVFHLNNERGLDGGSRKRGEGEAKGEEVRTQNP